jgi:threonine/homoserine/homoserine lactone efflux protein
MVGFSGPFAPRSVDRLLWDTQMPVFQELGIMLIIAAIGICFLGLGAYAMRTPEKFLSSPLARNRFRLETPKWQVRAFGLVMVLFGALLFWVGSLKLANQLTGNAPALPALSTSPESTSSHYMERYGFCVFAILWGIFLNGAYAFCSPRGWRASWGKYASRTLAGPISVRICGVVMLLVGGFLLFEAAARCWTTV